MHYGLSTSITQSQGMNEKMPRKAFRFRRKSKLVDETDDLNTSIIQREFFHYCCFYFFL